MSALDKLTQDALRTEPDYSAAKDRLSDVHTVRLLHVAMGLVTEAGEFLDMLKKHVFYGRPIDKVNADEELGDVSWYLRVGAHELEKSLLGIMERNAAKLRLRFPEKFTEADANVRNLDAERKFLEEDFLR